MEQKPTAKATTISIVRARARVIAIAIAIAVTANAILNPHNIKANAKCPTYIGSYRSKKKKPNPTEIPNKNRAVGINSKKEKKKKKTYNPKLLIPSRSFHASTLKPCTPSTTAANSGYPSPECTLFPLPCPLRPSSSPTN